MWSAARLCYRNPDVQLFNKFLQTLPSGGDMEYVRTQDMAGLIDMTHLKQVGRFLNDWNNAEHEFLDKTLEAKRRTLRQSISDFLGFFALNTWNDQSSFQRVPPEWQGTDKDRYQETISKLNELADTMYQAHQELVRAARRKLNMPEAYGDGGS